jgi:hypothetical protein
MDMAAIGKTVLVQLPAGQRRFAINGDAVTGLYESMQCCGVCSGSVGYGLTGRG